MSAQHAHHLRVVPLEDGKPVTDCAGCEALQAQTEEQARIIHEQDLDLRKHRRETQNARRELARFLKEHPEHETVEKLFAYWQQQLNHPGAKLDDKRRYLLTFSLKTYSAQQLAAAIKGCAVAGNPNRKTGKLYDAINLIFRDADHIEDYIDRYVHWYRGRHGRPPEIRTLEEEEARHRREVNAQILTVQEKDKPRCAIFGDDS